ncbi:AbrB/MazE/SpoVT family DNA-binding domain-containing protein [Salinarimonas ramus]|nr:AbrB/MazE/SpoVT family DNA-binding domain-containing protein [Salinarimonas ramus]
MKVNLVAIGNSKGIRLPASVIKQCGFGDQIEMRVEGDKVVLQPVRKVRDGWDEACARMAAAGDDATLLDDMPATSWDDEEWEW